MSEEIAISSQARPFPNLGVLSFDTTEAARRLGVHKSFLDKLRTKPDGGGLKYVKLGRRILYRESDLQEYLQLHIVR